ncbi:MAG: hypothetical protein CMK28_08155 [Porticoccaceae bacterium]|nr:hypothetical protein [Porticoccaceae bacterium]
MGEMDERMKEKLIKKVVLATSGQIFGPLWVRETEALLFTLPIIWQCKPRHYPHLFRTLRRPTESH